MWTIACIMQTIIRNKLSVLGPMRWQVKNNYLNKLTNVSLFLCKAPAFYNFPHLKHPVELNLPAF